jgi:sulfur-carrier protein adenylyltransferase/sulfurtransferase
MKPIYYLTIVLLTLGLVIALVPKNTVKPYKLSSEQLLNEIKNGAHFVLPDEVADLIIKKDPSVQLIDVRNPNEFNKYSLPGAINIPLQDILSDKWTDILDQGAKMNIFYSNGSLEAIEAWMLTRQMGYQNNYVLKGGLNYFADLILNPQVPPATTPDEEIAKYNFRKGAGLSLGGNALSPADNTVQKPTGNKPGVVPQAKKKKASGGC